MRKQYYVYILPNHSRTLYIGMSNNLPRRLSEHQAGQSGFTARYNLDILVHVEVFDRPIDAILREKQIKRWSHAKKVALIEARNPNWDELVPDV